MTILYNLRILSENFVFGYFWISECKFDSFKMSKYRMKRLQEDDFLFLFKF